jgi:probable HAF family extracellular repeat protein
VLGTLGGRLRSVDAVALNDRGQIVLQGWQKDRAGDRLRAFVWRNGRFQVLGPAASNGPVAAAINDSGQVVGETRVRGNRLHAVLWQHGTRIDLGALTPEEHSRAIAVNAGGQVLGLTQLEDPYFCTPPCGERAALWVFRPR